MTLLYFYHTSDVENALLFISSDEHVPSTGDLVRVTDADFDGGSSETDYVVRRVSWDFGNIFEDDSRSLYHIGVYIEEATDE